MGRRVEGNFLKETANMGISRDSRHKHRRTGGKQSDYRKKRKFEMGRQPAMTRIGPKRIRTVRCRGANLKYRALRLDTGNFSWGSEVTTRKTRVLDVMYNASNNELVRTKTLVKGAIIQIDATPFRMWYEQHYGILLGRRKKAKEGQEEEKEIPKSAHLLRKIAKRSETRTIDPALAEQFNQGRLFAMITSRPGQSGRCDGYILEQKELEFYYKKMQKKKAK